MSGIGGCGCDFWVSNIAGVKGCGLCDRFEIDVSGVALMIAAASARNVDNVSVQNCLGPRSVNVPSIMRRALPIFHLIDTAEIRRLNRDKIPFALLNRQK